MRLLVVGVGERGRRKGCLGVGIGVVLLVSVYVLGILLFDLI